MNFIISHIFEIFSWKTTISSDNFQVEIRTPPPLHLEKRIKSVHTDKKVGNTTAFIYKNVLAVLVNPALQFNYNKISRLVLSKFQTFKE